MTARARRRPAGRQSATKAAAKRVEPDAASARGHRAEPAHETGRPTSKDLDEREGRQSTKRKAKGPTGPSVTDDDVLIKKPTNITKKATTAEAPPNDPR